MGLYQHQHTVLWAVAGVFHRICQLIAKKFKQVREDLQKLQVMQTLSASEVISCQLLP